MTAPSPEPVIPLRPLSFREIFVGAFRATRLHWKVSIGSTAAVLVVGVALMVVAVAAVSSAGLAIFGVLGGDGSLGSLLVALIGILLFADLVVALIGVPADAAINGICVITADRAIRGEAVGVGRRDRTRESAVFFIVSTHGDVLLHLRSFMDCAVGRDIHRRISSGCSDILGLRRGDVRCRNSDQPRADCC